MSHNVTIQVLWSIRYLAYGTLFATARIRTKPEPCPISLRLNDCTKNKLELKRRIWRNNDTAKAKQSNQTKKNHDASWLVLVHLSTPIQRYKSAANIHLNSSAACTIPKPNHKPYHLISASLRVHTI